MNQRLIAEIGKSQRLRVVNRLKRTQGLCVSELAAALGMSYMGVKQHCVELGTAWATSTPGAAEGRHAGWAAPNWSTG